MTSWNLLVRLVMLIQKWLYITCFEMALTLGKATQECGLKHCQTADYRCTNVWQTTLWEVQKAWVFPSPLMVIMNFVFSSPSLLTLSAEPFFNFTSFGRVVSASDSQSGRSGFESRSGDFAFVLGRPELKSSATLVNSQLDAFCQLALLKFELLVSKSLSE